MVNSYAHRRPVASVSRMPQWKATESCLFQALNSDRVHKSASSLRLCGFYERQLMRQMSPSHGKPLMSKGAVKMWTRGPGSWPRAWSASRPSLLSPPGGITPMPSTQGFLVLDTWLGAGDKKMTKTSPALKELLVLLGEKAVCLKNWNTGILTSYSLLFPGA